MPGALHSEPGKAQIWINKTELAIFYRLTIILVIYPKVRFIVEIRIFQLYIITIEIDIVRMSKFIYISKMSIKRIIANLKILRNLSNMSSEFNILRLNLISGFLSTKRLQQSNK